MINFSNIQDIIQQENEQTIAQYKNEQPKLKQVSQNEKQESQDKQKSGKQELCSNHPKFELQYFCLSNLCRNQKKLICSECVKEYHHNHNIYDLSKLTDILKKTYQQQRLHLESELKKRDQSMELIESSFRQIRQDLENYISSIRIELTEKNFILQNEDNKFKEWMSKVETLSNEDILSEVILNNKTQNNLGGIQSSIQMIIDVQKDLNRLIQIQQQSTFSIKQLREENSIKDKQVYSHVYKWDNEIEQIKKSRDLILDQLNVKESKNVSQSINITIQDIQNKDQYKIQLLNSLKSNQSQKVSIKCEEAKDFSKNEYVKTVMKILNEFDNLQKLSISFQNNKQPYLNTITHTQLVNVFNLKNLTKLKIKIFIQEYETVKGILQKSPNLNSINLKIIQAGNSLDGFNKFIFLFQQLNLTEIKLSLTNFKKVRQSPFQVLGKLVSKTLTQIKTLLQLKRETLKIFKLRGFQIKFDQGKGVFNEFFGSDTFPSIKQFQMQFFFSYWSSYQRYNFFNVFPQIEYLLVSNYPERLVEQRTQQRNRLIRLFALLKQFLPQRKEILQEILYLSASKVFQ